MSKIELNLTPAGLRQIANDFACNADNPLHRENLKTVVRSALENAANQIEELRARVSLPDVTLTFALDTAATADLPRDET